MSLLTYLLTYLLTPWCRVLIEKLTGLQLVKKFPAFHGTQRFITALTSVLHLSQSWASPIQSIHPHPTSWRSILILSTHLRLGLRSGLLPSAFPTKTLHTPLSSPIRATCPAHCVLTVVLWTTLFLLQRILFNIKETKAWTGGFFTEKLSWLIYVAITFPEGLRRITNLSKLPHKRLVPAQISAEVVDLNYSPSGCRKLRFKHNRSSEIAALTFYQIP